MLSFANKINFEFHNGITGIVGPNGSGKSNVADAVRWVLGEQKTKQLRSSKMEDVIFAGTENRKPMGYAYVAITFDNADHKLNIDYDEVTVSRRLFRSGESEYMINGTQVRLKDINELFYDTGIGKEGYSIIGQGQIDKILSGKPEERRELFDEAAGIVKFKRRKNEALRKLDDQNQNLVRVSDILGELERQVVPLEKQCEKAKRYLLLKDDLKVNDVNMFLIEYNEIKNRLTQLDEKIKIAKYAASLINDGDLVYIDAGTTTEYMIEYITAKDATFVTNALSHAVGLARKGFKVYIIGGLIKSVTEAIIDSEAIISLSKYNFTKGFFGTNGLSSDRGFTTPDVREADIKNFAMRRCAKKFVLCDSSKFNKISKATFAAGSDITVITDKITENIKGYNIKEAAQL